MRLAARPGRRRRGVRRGAGSARPSTAARRSRCGTAPGGGRTVERHDLAGRELVRPGHDEPAIGHRERKALVAMGRAAAADRPPTRADQGCAASAAPRTGGRCLVGRALPRRRCQRLRRLRAGRAGAEDAFEVVDAHDSAAKCSRSTGLAPAAYRSARACSVAAAASRPMVMQYVPARIPSSTTAGKLVQRLQRQLLSGGGHPFLQRLDGGGRGAARPFPGELGGPVAIRGPQPGRRAIPCRPAGRGWRRAAVAAARTVLPGTRW